MKISIVNQQTTNKWDKGWESLIRKTVNHIGKMRKLATATEVNVVMVDSQYIRELNFIYRGIDQSTDVLSFAMRETADAEPDYEVMEPDNMLGDIVICLDIAQAQAEEYGHPLDRELAYLTVHGMLHLLGYDHEEEGERQLMRALEEKILEGLGLTR